MGGLEQRLYGTPVHAPEFNQLATKCLRNIKESIASLDVDLLKLATKGVGTGTINHVIKMCYDQHVI